MNNFVCSTRCTKDYVQFYYGTTLNSNNIVRISGTTDGRICDNRGYTLTYRMYTELITVYFHTDGSGSGSRGLDLSFNAIGNQKDCMYSQLKNLQLLAR